MTESDKKLYEIFGLILDDGDGYVSYVWEPTILELHKWCKSKKATWYQNWSRFGIIVHKWLSVQTYTKYVTLSQWPDERTINYDASLPLLDQSEETKKAIISLLESVK